MGEHDTGTAPPADGRFAAHHHLCDKGWAHGYLGVYDRLLHGVRVRRVLEIGVMDGASIAMWVDCLPGAEIVAVDVDSYRVADARVRFADTDSPVTVLEGDAYDSGFVAQLLDRYGPGSFDFIVDDGSHQIGDQWAFLERYPALLAPGGVLVVEDILPASGDAMASAKTLLECVATSDSAGSYPVDCRWPGSRWGDDILVVVDRRPDPWHGWATARQD